MLRALSLLAILLMPGLTLANPPTEVSPEAVIAAKVTGAALGVTLAPVLVTGATLALPVVAQALASPPAGFIPAVAAVAAAPTMPAEVVDEVPTPPPSGTPWWVVVLQWLAPLLGTIITVGLPILLAKVFRSIDKKTGWHTEEWGLAIAKREVLHLEQTMRGVIDEDLADGKFSAEEAKARIGRLGAKAVKVLLDEGFDESVAAKMVDAAMLLTGASSGPKGKAMAAGTLLKVTPSDPT